MYEYISELTIVNILAGIHLCNVVPWTKTWIWIQAHTESARDKDIDRDADADTDTYKNRVKYRRTH